MSTRQLPHDLHGEIVQYLDVTVDVFLPGFERQWKKATVFVQTMVQGGPCQYVNGVVHSINDEPAMMMDNNDALAFEKRWVRHGVLHRDHDRPAVEVDQPPELGPSYREWYRDGKRSRDNGQPVIEMRRDEFYDASYFIIDPANVKIVDTFS